MADYEKNPDKMSERELRSEVRALRNEVKAWKPDFAYEGKACPGCGRKYDCQGQVMGELNPNEMAFMAEPEFISPTLKFYESGFAKPVMTVDPQPFEITFQTEVSHVGKLKFDNEGQLFFEGQASQSARIFFEQVVKLHNKELDRLDELESMLHRIKSWCEAYPVDVFTPPDWSEVSNLLGPELLSQVSAANMRHVVDGITEIITQCEKDST